MPVIELSPFGLLVANVGGWAVVHGATGYVAHRLPLRWLQRDAGVLHIPAWEVDGRFHERVLRIRRWKDRVPEAGALFAGGISKRRLLGPAAPGLERFVVETRRAEVAHWLAVACTPVFVLWNPPIGVVLVAVYGVAANVPFIAIQRYNRARAERALARRGERSSTSAVEAEARRSRTNGRSMP